MNMLADIGSRHACRRQAEKCRAMGSPFVASILEAVDRQLLVAPMTADIVTHWPGDPASAAVALRLNSALHALARRGTPTYLAELYRREHEDFDGAVAAALAENDPFIAQWIGHPTQTNEVARCAAVMSGLMSLGFDRPMRFELLEMGASCGLNLNMARYGYTLGAARVGDPLSAVEIAPQWRGASPTAGPVEIVSARGIDLHPLNATDVGDRERLLAFAWADHPDRSRRLEDALHLAVEHPPRVDQGDACEWLERQLAEPQPAGHCRAIVHTMFLQYLSAAQRQHLMALLATAGQAATVDRPLVLIGLEWTTDRRDVELSLTRWPGGDSTVLAKCHPYGDWIDWRDPTSDM